MNGTITVTDVLGAINHVPMCNALTMPRNEECSCGATLIALVQRTIDSDYALLRSTISESLGRFIQEDDVAEVAILCDAIEKAAKHIAWLEAETPEKKP